MIRPTSPSQKPAPSVAARADPRTTLDADTLAAANAIAMPRVGSNTNDALGLFFGLGGAVLLGVLTFSTLSSVREKEPPPPEPAPIFQPPPAPTPIEEPVRFVPPPPPPPAPEPTPPPPVDEYRLRAPALVLDLTRAPSPSLQTPQGAVGSGDQGTAEERFADRLAQAEAQTARAGRMTSTTEVIPQGTIISAVLETAIDSDLPGYVRAVVSRDVTGFDGRKVLVPRGSRLIGQYRSGLSLGQTRAFVIWTRLLRPDGVSIQLASPATDPLGRAGLSGKVDNHFLQRFGSAVLLSVIGGAVNAFGDGNAEVVIRSTEDARSVAAIALQRSIDIPPTIKVAHGAPIRIFTARDLDFSTVDQPEPANGATFVSNAPGAPAPFAPPAAIGGLPPGPRPQPMPDTEGTPDIP